MYRLQSGSVFLPQRPGVWSAEGLDVGGSDNDWRAEHWTSAGLFMCCKAEPSSPFAYTKINLSWE